MSKLNPTTLTIAAAVLLMLALLVMATPLMRVANVVNSTGANRQFNGQALPGGQNFVPGQGNGLPGQGVPGQDNGSQGQDGTNLPNRQFGSPSSLLSFTFLGGITAILIYGIALLVSLVAAVGMFLTRRWGQILGILMGVVYLLLAVLGFLPMLLSAFRFNLNPLTLGLDILRLVLALAVIVLALIPARKAVSSLPAAQDAPPAAGA